MCKSDLLIEFDGAFVVFTIPTQSPDLCVCDTVSAMRKPKVKVRTTEEESDAENDVITLLSDSDDDSFESDDEDIETQHTSFGGQSVDNSLNLDDDDSDSDIIILDESPGRTPVVSTTYTSSSSSRSAISARPRAVRPAAPPPQPKRIRRQPTLDDDEDMEELWVFHFVVITALCDRRTVKKFSNPRQMLSSLLQAVCKEVGVALGPQRVL